MTIDALIEKLEASKAGYRGTIGMAVPPLSPYEIGFNCGIDAVISMIRQHLTEEKGLAGVKAEPIPVPSDEEGPDACRTAFEEWFNPNAHNAKALKVLGLRGMLWCAFQMGWQACAAVWRERLGSADTINAEPVPFPERQNDGYLCDVAAGEASDVERIMNALEPHMTVCLPTGDVATVMEKQLRSAARAVVAAFDKPTKPVPLERYAKLIQTAQFGEQQSGWNLPLFLDAAKAVLDEAGVKYVA